MIGGFALLLGCQLAGEALRIGARLPVPGGVLGMMILTLLLVACPGLKVAQGGDASAASGVERVANTLFANMGVLFVPAGVGVVAQLAILKAQWLPILAGVLGSTLLGLVVTAVIMCWILGPTSEASGR